MEKMEIARQIKIFDTTLRNGERPPAAGMRRKNSKPQNSVSGPAVLRRVFRCYVRAAARSSTRMVPKLGLAAKLFVVVRFDHDPPV
jgi:hypothetical protein